MPQKGDAMTEDPTELRKAYRFGDYLYYTAAGMVPLLTGAVAIYPRSALGLIFYGVIVAAGAIAMLYFFCVHCPHYQKTGRTLKCIFFWGLPKLFAPRPAPLNRVEKAAAFGIVAGVLFFPLSWLAEDPGLLAIYLLSAAVFGLTIRRCECRRCTFFDCPANAAPAKAGGQKNGA
jgi:hypothetical protein